jgi:hypothetical protein
MRFLSIPVRNPVGIAVAILLMAALSPGQAEACGSVSHGDVVAAETPIPIQFPTAPQPPCDGPNCSRKPATPSAPVSAPSSDSGGAKQLIGLFRCNPEGDTAEMVRGAVRLILPQSSSGSVYHPPRVG